ncbi:otu domain-containing protein 1 [Plakobranchus ocellatus]|uniref:Otu domain-containing protein 1 n=1 Tax=Plakobranchus ocellatus TaxID=259542 RepID=A0AAV4E0S1_9GAST|nr:otu domain-containing protein 1 [Plakobranchus ocellatus]
MVVDHYSLRNRFVPVGFKDSINLRSKKQGLRQKKAPRLSLSAVDLLDVFRPLPSLLSSKEDDMEQGPTIFDHFPNFPLHLHPLIYDGIRPGQRRGTSTESFRADQPSSKVKEIPIKIEHVSSNRGSTKNLARRNAYKSTHISPIELDDEQVNLIDSPKGEKHFKASPVRLFEPKSSLLFDNSSDECDNRKAMVDLTSDLSVSSDGFKSKKIEKPSPTIDLTSTPKALNNSFKTGRQTNLAHPKDKWTIIPITYVDSKSPVNKTFSSQDSSCEKTIVREVKEQARANNKEKSCDSFANSNLQDCCTETSTDRAILPNKHNLNIEDIHLDLASANNLEGSDLSSPQKVSLFKDVTARNSLLDEQEVNPAPSYPIYDELRKQLSQESRKVDYIRGDGNCFFRALSKQLYGTEKYHKAVRSLIVDVIATNRSSFAQFIDGQDIQAHIDRMSEENTWATTCEIYAAATYLQRDIFMLTPDHSNTHYSWLLFKPLFKFSKTSGSFQVSFNLTIVKYLMCP